MLATTATAAMTTAAATRRKEHPAARQGRQQGDHDRHFCNSTQHHHFTLFQDENHKFLAVSDSDCATLSSA
ncbi:hypothetical protein PUP68_22830 [Pseudomonas chlororaphis]|uniref:hypothetical protein n=1 Tax=Pseudomonas chlororaphis TaxID=587753 RepID=UPI002367CF4B|nr:hypothetical protein [Pseudomonas chlororaphis]WDG77092.1 hypothetical protein PUP77_22030 [Pseudomonas chlororaphis]WDG83668.1 hypothetical protein PUP68_22830 [Pseudomonas chlororaphis]